MGEHDHSWNKEEDPTAPIQFLVFTAIVAFGFYEWVYSLSLLWQYLEKRNSAVYRLSVFGATSHFLVIFFYYRILEYFLHDERIPSTTANTTPLIFAVSGMVQAIVLIVGLLRYRHLYSYHSKFVPMVTVLVIIGIVYILLIGIVYAVVLSIILQSPESLTWYPILNIFTGVAILYCSILDVFLSHAFFRAVIKGFGVDETCQKMRRSTEIQRLSSVIVIASTYAVFQLAAGVLYLVLPKSLIKYVTIWTFWTNFLPAWLNIYALNTFILMSYSTVKTLMLENSVGLRTQPKQSTPLQTISEHENFSFTSNDSVRIMTKYPPRPHSPTTISE